MTEPARGARPGEPVAGGGLGAWETPADRARAWHDLALQLAATGRRDRALVAARTAMELRSRQPDEARLDGSRRLVTALTGPDVVPMHVDVAAGEHDTGVQARAQARAVWVGAPAEPVLAMLGWVEHEGSLEVVRVVVPGTRRGRGAFALLVAALPDLVPVRATLPLRDPEVLALCRRAGFEVVPGSQGPQGHRGGSLQVQRRATGG